MAKKRGRPVESEVRVNIINLIGAMGPMYGYKLYTHYKEIFPSVTMRLIYYHLQKGVKLGLFVQSKVEKEKGDYSWGPEAEKIYYDLGPKAKSKNDIRIKQYLEAKKK